MKTQFTELEIRNTVDSVVYGNPDAKTSWGQKLAFAMIEKLPLLLSDLLSHGKGFNDSTKKAFCKLLDVKPVLTATAIDNLIVELCGISLHELIAHRNIRGAKQVLKFKAEQVADRYSNPEEALDLIHQQYESGYTKIVKEGRKTFLCNADNRGFHYKSEMKDYAIAYVELKDFEAELESLKA